MAWLLAKPVITAPIVGATKLYHLDALASVNVKLSADEIISLEEPDVAHAVVPFSRSASRRRFVPLASFLVRTTWIFAALRKPRM